MISAKDVYLSYCSATQTLLKLRDMPLLLLRLYLAPIFIQAGWNKLNAFDNTVQWFGNTEWGLGLPMPELMVGLAAGTEFIGGWLLLIGLFTRLVSLPLALTMVIAALTVHAKNGWLAIADASSWFANGTIFYNQRIMESIDKKEMANSILMEHGNYEWLTSSGSFTILNNGVEFAVTYLIMTLVLLIFGGGQFTSADYYAKKFIENKINK